MVPRRRSFGARGRLRGFGRQGCFRDFVEKHAVPPARQPIGDALRRGLVGEGTHPDSVIGAFRPLARGHVGIGEPVLHLLEHHLRLVMIFKGPDLNPIHEGLIGVLSQICFFESFGVCKSLELQIPGFRILPPQSNSATEPKTDIQVKGPWRDLYRAVDTCGQTIDFLLTEQRDERAAMRFLTKAIRRHGVPEKITIDGSEANAGAIRSDIEEHGTAIIIRQVKYISTILWSRIIEPSSG
jgi:DDE domain